MERAILHCDLNNFYASVECRDNPELAQHPIAVCGKEDDRHGIVLAKNQIAKQYGVKTTETIWQARIKCPSLVVVSPHYERYFHFSRLARQIYSRYTNQIEPFGIDECWLDVTGSTDLFGAPEKIADRLREEVFQELGLTISVGVSFNKVFAKLGSDLKKPNGTTVISRENYTSLVYPLPATDLLGVGAAVAKRLRSVGIYTIGEIAAASPEQLQRMFGKNGFKLWQSACGLEDAPVCDESFHPTPKSVGNSSTCRENLSEDFQVWQVLLTLSEEVSRRLRKEGLLASQLAISVKDDLLHTCEYSTTLAVPTRCCTTLAKGCMKLFQDNWRWLRDVRALGVRTGNLVSEQEGTQTTLFDVAQEDFGRQETLESKVDQLRKRYGREILRRGTLMLPSAMPEINTTKEIHMPTFGSR